MEQRVRSLDFLRGLAIFLVVLVHTSQHFFFDENITKVLSLGRFGVQLFFLVSGYTMYYIWELRSGERCHIFNFYIRRFFRIAPLFWLAIILHFLIEPNLRHNLFQIAWVTSIFHWISPTSAGAIVPGGWSISIEMTFYLIFPLLACLKMNGRTHLVIAMLTWVFYTFILRSELMKILHILEFPNYAIGDFVYMNFLNQLPVFLLGGYLFLVGEHIKRSELLLLFFWGAISLLLGTRDEAFNFAFVYLLLFLLVVLVIRYDFKLTFVETLGRNSYGIYLAHPFVMKYLKTIPNVSFLAGIALVLFASYLLSVIVDRLIAKKIHFLVERLIRKRSMIT